MRIAPIEAAEQFVDKYFPHSSIALLAGSASRGEQRENSDLDIVIIDDTQKRAYRESFFEFGWRIEAFIHTSESPHQYFESDRKRARPTLPHMFVSGLILRDDGSAQPLIQKARKLLDDGPEKLTPQEIFESRYFLTDLLDDFIDANHLNEAIFTLNTLSIQVVEFVLKSNYTWIGRGKGLAKAFENYDEELHRRFIDSLNSFYVDRDKGPFIQFVDDVLKPFGGRLFEGFSMGKELYKN